MSAETMPIEDSPQQTGGRSGWMATAACKDADSSLFYPPPGGELSSQKSLREERAKAFCGKCAVKIECLGWAYRTGDTYTILGNTTPDERSALRRAELRRRPKPRLPEEILPEEAEQSIISD